MAKKVIGSFGTEEEAIDTVNNLETKGYKPENLTILTDRGKAEKLEEDTDIQVETGVSRNKQNETFKDKIKRAFIQDVGPEDQLSTKEKLMGFGLSENQISSYARDLENGNILLLAEEDGLGGKTPPIPDDNLDALDRTGRTNVAEDDVASTSENQNITADEAEPSREERNNEENISADNETNEREEKTLEENPVLNKSKQERDGRSL